MTPSLSSSASSRLCGVGICLLAWSRGPVERSAAFSFSPEIRPRARGPPAETVGDGAGASFREWCETVGIRASKLEHSRSGGGVPGVAVRPGASLRAGEAAIILPLDAALAVLADDDPGGCDAPGVLDDAAWSDASPQLRLAARLLLERSKGPASRWAGYIRHLPPASGPGRERCETLARWTDAELRRLRSPALTAKTAERARRDGEWYRRLVCHRSGGARQGDDAVPITREEFDWALDVVRTRHFRGDFAPGKRRRSEQRKDDYALLPFIDDLNHRQTTSGASYGDLSSPSSNGASSPAFLPVRDVLDRTADAVCWIAHRVFSEGDEVAHAYLHSADAIAEAFLDEWGFILAAEEMDACAVYVGAIRCVVRGDGHLDDQDCKVDAIREEMMQRCTGSSSEVTKADIWQCIAKACYNEALLFECCEDDKSATVSPSRQAIANAFVDGKLMLLRSGLEYALLRTQEAG